MRVLRERFTKRTSFTCRAPASASLYTATLRIPSFLAVRMTRQAISPLPYIDYIHSKLWTHTTDLFAMSILSKCGFLSCARNEDAPC